jgi:hypothetical protein
MIGNFWINTNTTHGLGNGFAICNHCGHPVSFGILKNQYIRNDHDPQYNILLDSHPRIDYHCNIESIKKYLTKVLNGKK